jgi:hypothetical protein
VERIVKAWDDSSMDPRQSTEDILQCLFHPAFHNGQCEWCQVREQLGDSYPRIVNFSANPAIDVGEDATM